MVLMMSLESRDIEKMLTPIINSQGCDMIEIKCKGSHTRPIIQVFVDRAGGINIDDCAKLSRQMKDALDMSMPDIPQYRLEISSPGVHRPLKTERDFARNIGRVARIVYMVDENESSIEGKIIGINRDRVIIQAKERTIEIPIESIRQARIQLKW
jgi:ribosome maturation factor RimP